MILRILNSKIRQVYGLVALLLVIKLCLLPFAQTVHPDAVSRIFASINWMNDPHWIKSGAWPPFHFYLNSLFLSLWNNPIYTPKLINLVLSCLTLIPFFLYVRREFNENGAFVATVFLAICPILFRNSFQALAGTPYIFFVVLGLNWLSKALKEKKHAYYVLAGFAVTCAAGFRYEAWLLMIVLWFVVIWKREWRHSFIFGLAAVVFPVIWLVSNWMETGNALFGIQGNYNWTLEVMGNNDSVDLESHLRRIWFFPFSLMIALGPPAAYITIKMIFRSYKTQTSAVAWSIPFWIFLVFVIYNCSKGVLLLQHRFTGTLVVLSLPFLAIYFNELTRRKTIIAGVFGVLTVGMSFIYNTNGVTPVPRLHDQSIVTVAELIEKNTDQNAGVILDFIGWDGTYFIALNSGLPRGNMVILEGAKNSVIPTDQIKSILNRFESGILLLAHRSNLSEVLGRTVDLSLIRSSIKSKIETTRIFQSKRFDLYVWNKK